MGDDRSDQIMIYVVPYVPFIISYHIISQHNKSHITVCQLADGIAITYGGVLGGAHDHGAGVGRIGRGMRLVRCAYATRGNHLFIAFVLPKLLSPGFQTNQNYLKRTSEGQPAYIDVS
jgi:hypothetical protein